MLDLDIKEIEQSEIPQFAWTGGSTHLSYFEQALLRTLNGEVLFLGAWLNHQAIGRCGIDFERIPGKAMIWMFNVKDEFQGMGIGTKMMEKVEEVVTSRNIKTVVLNVEKDNVRAQNLYKKLGYEIVGEGEESWEEDDVNGGSTTYIAKVVQMEKKLKKL